MTSSLAIGVSETILLPTGELTLTVHDGPPLRQLCDFAARSNPKRGFLIVSKVLGRHLPTAPSEMRASMETLARKISPDLPQPVVFLGMAETATALGQGIFAAYRRNNPSVEVLYLQSSRQRVEGARVFASFEEGHSHATSHLVQIADPALEAMARAAQSLVIVDDECSTGNTFVAAAEALSRGMPKLRRIETCCLTDWGGGGYLKAMPLATQARSILCGSMTWQARTAVAPLVLAASSNQAGVAPSQGMLSRTGLRDPEAAERSAIVVQPGERVLVLGDGEHSYEALRVAEAVEDQGGIAAVQCITRSPALIGHAMQSLSRFSDAYGSGAPCFLYNMLGHRPDRVLILTEVVRDQAAEARAALALLGADIPVEVIVCHYRRDGQ
ncbi:conserved hypotheti [Asticcacaulis biprosthecium C19]|uniref:Conserved hypotheti n=1 Tax=Asticcacaulis biprosthecium C19 TaxID=715226 RepID=F4QGW2_9CAUL|nr:phosphoribosyltransferase domain-containing protein [Asticcacaulis biprosthecium]EGF93715.1 conserved hypotheti [Asticcacaulis biprosthecium C19]